MRVLLIFIGTIALVALALMYVTMVIGISMDLYFGEGEPDYDDEPGSRKDSEAKEEKRA